MIFILYGGGRCLKQVVINIVRTCVSVGLLVELHCARMIKMVKVASARNLIFVSFLFVCFFSMEVSVKKHQIFHLQRWTREYKGCGVLQTENSRQHSMNIQICEQSWQDCIQIYMKYERLSDKDIIKIQRPDSAYGAIGSCLGCWPFIIFLFFSGVGGGGGGGWSLCSAGASQDFKWLFGTETAVGFVHTRLLHGIWLANGTHHILYQYYRLWQNRVGEWGGERCWSQSRTNGSAPCAGCCIDVCFTYRLCQAVVVYHMCTLHFTTKEFIIG